MATVDASKPKQQPGYLVGQPHGVAVSTQSKVGTRPDMTLYVART